MNGQMFLAVEATRRFASSVLRYSLQLCAKCAKESKSTRCDALEKRKHVAGDFRVSFAAMSNLMSAVVNFLC